MVWLPRPDMVTETAIGPVLAVDVRRSPIGGDDVRSGNEEGVAREEAVELGTAAGVTLAVGPAGLGDGLPGDGGPDDGGMDTDASGSGEGVGMTLEQPARPTQSVSKTEKAKR